MKNLVILIVLLATALFAGQKARTGTKITVKRGDKVVYETPCGYTEIINPLKAENGGGVFSGAAVDALATITVRYWNHTLAGCYYNEPAYAERIKNFPMNDYELDFIRSGCETWCYDR